ncbi:MAG: DUF2141 domain-containing protein [Betaproteobacteria bacterium]|nr:DUF2141 domain-containing protein [Betaproteobacteria bacterium]
MASLGLGGAAASAQPSARQLTVQASGFAANNGHAVAKLFVPGADVLKRGNQEIKAEIRDGKATFVFPALPAGEYAVVVFHDANDNGVIDHNRLGLPSESLGFSNAFRLSLTAGLPSFEKLRFSHGAQAQSIAIAVE